MTKGLGVVRLPKPMTRLPPSRSLAASGVKSESDETSAKPSIASAASCTRSIASIAIAMSEVPLPETIANCVVGRNESWFEIAFHGTKCALEKSP